MNTLHLEDYNLSLSVVPQLGGKISSILWNGREVLAQNPYKPLRTAQYGAPFSDYDASGFDECLPTIGSCCYPEPPFQGLVAPDHGELWSIPWTEIVDSSDIHLQVKGIHFPYQLDRWVSIAAPGQIRLRYELVNLSNSPFKFIWSAHPLFAIKPNMRIILPQDVRVKIDWSKDNRLGGLLYEHPWPITRDRSGEIVDLSMILTKESKRVDKLYTTRLKEGWCVLYDHKDDYYVGISFSPHQIPYLGLSINLGGWPVDGIGYYNLGIEPCNGYPDRLDIAIEKGDYQTLAPRNQMVWEWVLRIGRAANLETALSTVRSF